MNDRNTPDDRASADTGHEPHAADAQADKQADLFGFVAPEPSVAPAAAKTPRTKHERAPVDTAAESPPATGELTGFEAPQPSRPAAATASSAASAPKRRARGVLPAVADQATLDLGAQLPPQVHLGTSSWSFPGWQGIVYGDDYSNAKLARDGLAAYSAHPLLRSVSIDRSFYAPLSIADYLRYAQQVPDHFRFIVKAPASITDASVRGDRGEPVAANPCFLNAQLATSEFVEPCLAGLGQKAGALVFQFPPLPDQLLADPAVFVERLQAFLTALPPLPATPGGPCYAIEIRDAILLTPRFVRMLRAVGVRYCVGLHARMPDPLRQATALALMDGETPAGPLIVRWSLHSGFRYEQAKARYEPFDKLVDEDPHTRDALAELAARYALAGQPVLITTNNKAEGSAPLSCAKLARAIADEFLRLKSETAPEDDAEEAPEET
jgi:uncharacterized protein YecE (DUF72 family)